MKSTLHTYSEAESVSEFKILFRCSLCAFVIELLVLTGFGWKSHWLAHPRKITGLDETHFVEAQMYEVPEKAELREEHVSKTVTFQEPSISKEVGKGREAKPSETAMPQENDVKHGEASTLSPTHGPVAVFTPSPVVPSFLREEELHTSVVIEFLISAQGGVTPRLLSSSGNEELDALAVATAETWRFRPAEQDHHPIDSRVRLRIVFEVR